MCWPELRIAGQEHHIMVLRRDDGERIGVGKPPSSSGSIRFAHPPLDGSTGSAFLQRRPLVSDLTLPFDWWRAYDHCATE
jgi:hypothetical protein